MTTAPSYHVYSRDAFVPELFPDITSELKSLYGNFHFIHDPNRLSNLVLWLKGKMADSGWTYANPLKQALAWTENFRPIHIQSLFQACRYNDKFSAALEQYIRQELSQAYRN